MFHKAHIDGLTETLAARPLHPAVRHRRWLRVSAWVVASLTTLVVVAVIASYFVDEPLRRHMEAQLNGDLKGYSVRLPGLSVHPLGLSITLRDLTVAQQAHPAPPVATFPEVDASVHWRALLHRRLVGDFLLVHPLVHINRPQLQHEAADALPLKDKGWQEALGTIYPLKINRLRIQNGDLTYIDDDPNRPLHLHEVNLVANNIRNVRSPDRVYPSDVHVRGTVFDAGSLRIDGKANFLAEPFAGVDADVVVEKMNLTYFKPILERLNLHIADGSLSADGHIEYAPQTQSVHLKHVSLGKVRVDYTHSSQTAAAEQQRATKLEDAARTLTQEPVMVVHLDRLHIADSTFGYVDQSAEPNFRVYITNSDLTVTAVSNQPKDGPASIDLTGEFMGSGTSRVHATCRPMATRTDLEMTTAVDGTDLRALNDCLRAYGDFDVVKGQFFLYSQLTISRDEISGYLKPIFRDVQVYGSPQDTGKPVLHQLYEGMVGAVKSALQNTHGEVGTRVDISGRVSDPQTSTWNIIMGLLRNAFIK